MSAVLFRQTKILRYFVCWQITPAEVKFQREEPCSANLLHPKMQAEKMRMRRRQSPFFLRGTKVRWQVTQLLSLWTCFHFRSFPIFPRVSEIQTGYMCQPDLTLMHCNKETERWASDLQNCPAALVSDEAIKAWWTIWPWTKLTPTK